MFFIGKDFFKRIDKKIYLFLFFLMISASLWLLNTLNGNFVSKINIPVRFENFPEQYVPITKVPESISASVKAHGFVLARHFFSVGIDTVVIDYAGQSHLIKRPGKSLSYVMPTSALVVQLSKQLSDGIDILEIEPDSLHFNFDKIKKKQVQVKSLITARFQLQHQWKNEPKITPEFIGVYGRADILDTIKAVYTEKKFLTYVDGDVKLKLALADIDGLTFSEDSVDVFLSVEKFKQIKTEVQINIVNNVDNVKIELSDNKAWVTVNVGESHLSKFNSTMITLSVDASDFIKENKEKCTIFVSKKPSYAVVKSIEPKYTEMKIIEK